MHMLSYDDYRYATDELGMCQMKRLAPSQVVIHLLSLSIIQIVDYDLVSSGQYTLWETLN